ncbi:hypothetical protein CKM354_000862300 [Cercospora kikuchii]|uniref:Uncharacterized protein n=1 Tax=Cercospora kikuchii TaxID=84275 RepID=A0A9P3CQ23_9PEZI|nr:uncharacterized protein CKM354_000862300 [Cercospora kikuchii]GIZ45457.1 hypothetical protein CKM354_000862300 [Cercospora kikuchii]
MAPSLHRLLRKTSLPAVKTEEVELTSLQRSNSDEALSRLREDTLRQIRAANLASGRRQPLSELPVREPVVEFTTRRQPLSELPVPEPFEVRQLDRSVRRSSDRRPPLPLVESSKRRPTPVTPLIVDNYRLDRSGGRTSNPRDSLQNKGKLQVPKFALPPPQKPLSSRVTRRDPISDRDLFELSTGEAGRDPPPKTKRITVRGREIEIVVTDTDGDNMAKPLEEDKPAEMENSNRRITRYGGRRPSVAESKQEEIDNVSARDFALKPRNEALQVPALNIRKANKGDKSPTRIPSPRSASRSPAEDLPVPPQTAENTRRISPDALTDPEYTHQPESTPSPSPSDSDSKQKESVPPPPPPKDAVGPSKHPKSAALPPAPTDTGTSSSLTSKAVKKFGFHTKQRAAAAEARAEKPAPLNTKPFIPKNVPVFVRPPVYNPNLPDGLQWCEAGKMSSRAAVPW